MRSISSIKHLLNTILHSKSGQKPETPDSGLVILELENRVLFDAAPINVEMVDPQEISQPDSDFEDLLSLTENLVDESLSDVERSSTAKSDWWMVHQHSLHSQGDNAPAINAESSLSVSENSTVVLTLSTENFDDSPALSVTGGADSELFEIDPDTHELKFKTPPSFENPTDSGANNYYDVEVTASDTHGNKAAQVISVEVLPENDPNASLRNENKLSVASLRQQNQDTGDNELPHEESGQSQLDSDDKSDEIIVEADAEQAIQDEAQVTLEINGLTLNERGDYQVVAGGLFSISEEILRGDVDPQSRIIILPQSRPEHGAFIRVSQSSFVYRPDLNYAGSDSFQYTLLDFNTMTVTNMTISFEVIAPSPEEGGETEEGEEAEEGGENGSTAELSEGPIEKLNEEELENEELSEILFGTETSQQGAIADYASIELTTQRNDTASLEFSVEGSFAANSRSVQDSVFFKYQHFQ